MLILYSDDLGLDRWSLMLHWGCVGLVVKMWLVRHRSVLSGLLMRRAVHSLLGVRLGFAIVRVMRGCLGVRLRLSVVGVVRSYPGTRLNRLRLSITGVMRGWQWVRLRLHWVLLWMVQ